MVKTPLKSSHIHIEMIKNANFSYGYQTSLAVQVLVPLPYQLNTLDQLAKSPVVSRCSGFFTAGNFLKTPWNNGRFAEVQTGFEPLFFHIQADFQWQRPFSEGCGGEIPEKSKKNLSQSYGRWIVGFHEPMTSAFFALKKGAEIGGMI